MNVVALCCKRSFFPEGNWNQVPLRQTQEAFRKLFRHWGLPERMRVDNGSPWGSWSDLPTDLALWLIGLGVEMIWNDPLRPQQNGVVERSQGTGKRWGEPFAQESPEDLQRRMDEMDHIQREEYPLEGARSRMELYPDLKHSGRRYTRRWEEKHCDFQRVLDHLAGYAVPRRVGKSGRVSVCNRSYYVSVVHEGKSVYVMLDPDTREWIFADEEGRQLSRQAAQENTPSNIMNLQVSKRPAIPRRRRRKAK